MWDLVKGLCEIHDDQICLLVPAIHRTIQVDEYIVHKLHQLGFTTPPTSEPMLSVSKYMLSKAKCLSMLLTNICFRVLQQMQVSYTGL